MDLIHALGLFVVSYYLFYLIYLWFLDCDVKLAFKEKFGKSADSLRGKVVWITGASSGIGEYLAYALAEVGCKLVLSARREAELQRVKNKCLEVNKNLQDDDVEVLVFDVCKLETHKKAFDRVIEKFSKLDILVNNAGRSQRAIWEDIEIDVDREMFTMNVFSVISLSRLALRYFLERGEGHLAVTSSFAGLIGVPFSGTYTGSKHALHGYFECLRSEKMDKNISITMICPGPIQTNFLSECYTDKIDKKFEQQAVISKSKMSPERCGKLIAVALANQLYEVWISHPPALQLVYLVRYYPNLSTFILSWLGQRYLQRLRDTKETVKQK